MRNSIIPCCIAVVFAMCAGCQEPHNIRMRFATALPTTPPQLVGVDAKDHVLLCNAESQEIIRTIGTAGATVRDLRMTADGSSVATLDTNGLCQVWDTGGGPPRLSVHVSGAGKASGAIAFSADGRLLAVGGRGGVEIYATDDRAMVRRIPDFRESGVYSGSTFEKLQSDLEDARVLSLDFSPAEHHLLMGTDQGLFEVNYLQCTLVWHSKSRSAASLVRYAPDGAHFIAQSASGKLDYFANHEPAFGLAPGEAEKGRRSSGHFTAAQFTVNGTYLAMMDSSGTFHVVRLPDQKPIMAVASGKLDTSAVAVSSDGRTAWVGSQGNVERFTRFPLPQEMGAGTLVAEPP